MPSAYSTPSSSQQTSSTAYQPAAKYPPKSPEAVLQEAEAQWIFTPEELLQAPSIIDGMPVETEREFRTKGVNFILQVGIMLKLPQLTLATAAVFFNRFLMRYSLVAKEGQAKPLHHYQIAAVSLFLATKTEENIRRTRELIVACCRVAQKNASLVIDEQSKDYWRWRDTLLLNEDVLLEKLCFDLTVDKPHQLLFDMLKALGAENNKRLRNAAWAFINDTCLTQMCLLFPSKTIAAAAVFCGAKYCGPDCRFADDEKDRPWWMQQGVKLKEIWRAANYMADLYEDQPPKQSGERSIYVGLRTPFSCPSSSASSAAAVAAATTLNASTAGAIISSDADTAAENAKDAAERSAEKAESDVGKRSHLSAYIHDDDDDDINFDDETRLRNTRSLLQTPASPAEWMVNPSGNSSFSTSGGGIGGGGGGGSGGSVGGVVAAIAPVTVGGSGEEKGAGVERAVEGTLVDRGIKRDREGTPKPSGMTSSPAPAPTSAATGATSSSTQIGKEGGIVDIEGRKRVKANGSGKVAQEASGLERGEADDEGSEEGEVEE